jgi:hypothetical protein
MLNVLPGLYDTLYGASIVILLRARTDLIRSVAHQHTQPLAQCIALTAQSRMIISCGEVSEHSKVRVYMQVWLGILLLPQYVSGNTATGCLRRLSMLTLLGGKLVPTRIHYLTFISSPVHAGRSKWGETNHGGYSYCGPTTEYFNCWPTL